jgi:cold shock CspA family protein
MEDQDQSLPCDACGGTFTFTAKERQFYADKGFNPPRRCAGARKARKASGQSERYENGCPFGTSQGSGSGPRRPMGDARPMRSARPQLPGTGVFRSGEIVKVMGDRGFGFLRGDDEQDYFFDEAAVGGGFARIYPGLRVTFEVVQAPRGPRAQNVSVE